MNKNDLLKKDAGIPSLTFTGGEPTLRKDLVELGRLLDHTWKLKRQTGTKVSTDTIDELYFRMMV